MDRGACRAAVRGVTDVTEGVSRRARAVRLFPSGSLSTPSASGAGHVAPCLCVHGGRFHGESVCAPVSERTERFRDRSRSAVPLCMAGVSMESAVQL